MNAGEVTNAWRVMVNEPNTNRFTVQDSLDFLNRACVQAALEIQFAEGTYTFSTVANQREYAMLETVQILRVYILGQNGTQMLLEPTDIPTMEGVKMNVFDRSSGSVAGNPPLSPAWLTEQPVQYPYQPLRSQNQGLPTNTWVHGDPPRWYMRGGNIGFVPPPNDIQTVVVDHIPKPPTAVSTSSLLEFPETMKDMLVYKMAQYSRLADGSSDAAKDAQLFDIEANKQRKWLDRFQASKSLTFIPWVRRNSGGYRGGWR